MNIEALIKARSPVRRAATEIIKSLELEINKPDKSFDLIDELIAKLTDKENNLKKLDLEILSSCKTEDIEKEVEKQQEYRDNIITWKIRASKILKKNETQSTESVVQPVSVESRTSHQVSLKLPRLQLSQYDGNILKFNDFYSQFEVAIDKNPNLSNVEKFNYLKSYLINEAEIAIRGLALSSDNYEIALKILKDRFGRKDIIIDAHMSKLLNLNPVRKSYDIVSLRKLYSECEMHIRGLENSGIDPNMYSCLLFPIIMKSLPKDLSLEYSRKAHSESKNEISNLLVFLKTEIECRERNDNLIREFGSNDSDLRKEARYANEKPIPKNKSKNRFDYKNKFSVPNVSSFTIDVKKCIFCSDSNNHDSAKCPLTVEQRKASLRKGGFCFLCLSRGHLYRNCVSKNRCGICKRKHSELIHEDLPVLHSSVGDSVSQNVFTSKVITCPSEKDSEVLLETCSAVILSKTRNKQINMLLDNASMRSFLLQKIAVELKLPIIRQENLFVYTFGARSPIQKTYDVAQITLCNVNDPSKRITIEVLLTDFISGKPFKVSPNKWEQMFKDRNISVSNVIESSGNELGLLIGAEYFWNIHSGEKEKINKSLFLIDTLFGKVVQGRISASDLDCKSIATMKIECCAALNENLTQFWKLEGMGINDTQYDHSKIDEEFISRFENNLKFKDGMYETKLFWDGKPENLDNNFVVAKRRFDSLSVKMKGNDWVCNEYKNIVKDQLKLNIVEECNSKVQSDSFYLPHSAVVRCDKESSKVRLVFDGSSKGKGCKSLNECLDPGPSLNPRILDVLLRFREHKYAFSSDIQGAFLTIGIAKEDRDYLRFLWFPGENDPNPYKILRMTKVSFGITSSPFILAATIKYHIQKYKQEHREAFDMLNSSLYVDDLFYGANTVEKALELSQSAVAILKEANMNLRKFNTNSVSLRKLWQEKGMTGVRELNGLPVKVLGIIWNFEEDNFKLDVQPLLDMIKIRTCSKRGVLQSALKLFDPVGFASPFIVTIKLLMQEIWEHGLSWDENLTSEMSKKWENWCSQVSLLKDLILERQYFACSLEQIKTLEIHVFSDASPRAFGAVAYFRYVTKNDSVSTCFISSKSRIAPLKRLTLPRLELMGAVVASRLLKYLNETLNFPITKTYLWSDSLITIHWIKGSASKWKPFVANRVTEIQSSTDPANWYHCRGIDNPADYISRGATVEKLISDSVWLQGPEWLRWPKEKWPVGSNEELFSKVPCKNAELKEISSFVCEVQPNLSSVLNLNKYSNLKRLCRVTGWVLRFIHNCKNKNKLCNELSIEELDGAEILLLKTVQKEVFPDELSCISQDKPISKNSKILELNPFLDKDGIMHIGGRLQKSKLDPLLKHPIIMPAKHHFVNLLIWNAHNKVFHSGVSETLIELREKYWVIKGRQAVKNLIKKCTLCKKFNSLPGAQVTAPLPALRIEQSPPFSVVGIDFGGPLYVKDIEQKHYIVLFTCSVTRAIHLELVDSLTTETFLLALRRFIARRGLCAKILTDNAQTFKRSEIELKNLWNVISHPTVKDFYASHKILWSYIAEKAAWWGGLYERLIRSVKLALRKTIKRTSLFRNELETLIIEIEGVLNSRPLTIQDKIEN